MSQQKFPIIAMPLSRCMITVEVRKNCRLCIKFLSEQSLNIIRKKFVFFLRNTLIKQNNYSFWLKCLCFDTFQQWLDFRKIPITRCQYRNSHHLLYSDLPSKNKGTFRRGWSFEILYYYLFHPSLNLMISQVNTHLSWHMLLFQTAHFLLSFVFPQ